MNKQSFQSGVLYIVATPIGNMRDISYRAIDVLNTVDFILAEDTKHTLKLLRAYNVSVSKLISLHEHNEREKVQLLIGKLKENFKIALVSDAGTPLISDPGYHLVAAARAHAITVVPVPGASAGIAALSVCGLPVDRFSFEGFLSAQKAKRVKQLQNLVDEERTLVFYESPHRILSCLHDMLAIFGENRQVFFAREMTKLHETYLQGTLAEICSIVSADDNQQRGECVVLLAANKENKKNVAEESMGKTLSVLQQYLSAHDAVQVTSMLTGVAKNKVYRLSIAANNLDDSDE